MKQFLSILIFSLWSLTLIAQQQYTYNQLNTYDILKYYLNGYGSLHQNVQSTNWSNFNVPFQLRAQALIEFKDINSLDYDKDVPKNIPRWKLSRFYFAGELITLEAFDKYRPLRSTHGEDKNKKTINYLETNFIFFKIYDKDNLDVTAASYAIPYGKNASNQDKNKIRKETGAILDTTLHVNDYLIVNFYRKKVDTLIASFYLKRIEVAPEIKKAWVVNKDAEEKLTVNNTGEFEIKVDETLVFELSKTRFHADSIIQYQLLNAKLADTSWHSISRFLTLSQLKSKGQYTLNLRYSFQKETLVSHRIIVKPNWYQTLTFYITIVFSCIMLIILIIKFVVSYKIKSALRKQNQIQQQIQSIQNQLNPHFTFNALSSIQGLINTNRVHEANDYLSEFSNLLRSTLANSHLIYVPLSKELHLLDTYLKLEQLRFGFTYQLTVSSEISQNDVDIPNFLLQPIIENAVKHGISLLGKKGTITVHFEKVYKNLSITISDNGKGFDENLVSAGYGVRFVKEKIKLINTLLRYEAIRLSFIKRNGTIVHISLNNWLP